VVRATHRTSEGFEMKTHEETTYGDGVRADACESGAWRS
jgi:hypothetical protein